MALSDRLQMLFPGISLRPALACEVSPYGVLAARQDAVNGLLTQFAPLPAAALQPGLKAGNVADRPALVSALRSAITAVAERGRPLPGGRNLRANRALTLIVPDAAVRVLLLDFDSLPGNRAEALPLLRFRLRKLVPFETEDAAISWQAMSTGTEGIRVLTIVIPRPVLIEYESAIRESGFLPGVVLPSTLAAAPLVGAEPTLLVNRNGNTLTTSIFRGQDLLLHRALEFASAETTGRPRSLEESDEEENQDIRQSVSVALAYFEDTLNATPQELYYNGPLTAETFQSMLGEPTITVRHLGALSESPSSAVPHSLLAPVTGALLNA